MLFWKIISWRTWEQNLRERILRERIIRGRNLRKKTRAKPPGWNLRPGANPPGAKSPGAKPPGFLYSILFMPYYYRRISRSDKNYLMLLFVKFSFKKYEEQLFSKHAPLLIYPKTLLHFIKNHDFSDISCLHFPAFFLPFDDRIFKITIKRCIFRQKINEEINKNQDLYVSWKCL